jgi:hypothetical protein
MTNSNIITANLTDTAILTVNCLQVLMLKLNNENERVIVMDTRD